LCQSANVAGTVDPKNDTTSSSPAPQIAGGVVGGIFLIALLVFVIWKFVLKGRRHAVVEEWDPADYPLEKPGSVVSIRDSRSRASTHTVASVATTVLTRASNVIQIAYIPGVTNRQASTPQSPTSSTHGVPVPPVPIPTNPPNETLSATASGQFLFLPSDLRDSTYTDLSELDAATRKSISPSLARQSYASTVFHQESAMPTAVLKAKPSLVSVSKSSTADSPCPTPPVPSIDPTKFAAAGAKPVLLQIPMASENGRKAPTTVATATPMKAKALFITKNKGSSRGSASTTSTSSNTLKPGRITSLAESQTTMGSPHTRAKQFGDDDSSDDDDGSGHERSRRSLLKRDASPFGDHAAADFMEGTKPKTNGESPFGDDHAL
jgi:protein OPY2